MSGLDWKALGRKAAMIVALLAVFAGVSVLFGDTLLHEDAGNQAPASIATALPATVEPKSEATPQATAIAAASVPQVDGATIVWVPNSGARYHATSECSGMQSPRAASVQEAVALGLTPCKRCNPPALETDIESPQ